MRRILREEMRSGGRRRRRTWPLMLAGAVSVMALVAVGVSLGWSGEPTDAAELKQTVPQSAPAPVEQSGAASEIRQTLDALPVGSGVPAADYDRDEFGQAWFDLDRNGCDTRNDMLRRDLRETVLKDDTNGCKVLSGVLDDWYSGATVDFVAGGDSSRLVQVDHLVPLSWAWQHGADAWDDEKRRMFANDPANLVATTERENSSKADSGPAEWLPTADAAQCRYAQRFTAVLDEYGLEIGLRDRAMIRGVLTECAVSDAFGGFD